MLCYFKLKRACRFIKKKMPKIHIDEVYPKSSVYPMVVSFQNGYTTDGFISSCSLLEDKTNGDQILTTEVAGLVYSAKESREDLGKTLILARNKTTGKVRLIEVGTAEFRPVLQDDSEKPSEIDTSYLELSRKFGSKKQKKHVEQREKLKVNVTTVTEQMHNVTVNITEDQMDISSYTKADSDDFYIPPINREADKPEHVYDLYKIMSKEQYDKVFFEIENKDYLSELQPWIKDMIATKKLSEEHTILALYTSCILRLSSLVFKEILKKDFTTCTSSPTLNEIILKNFTTYVNGKRNRSMQYKDKAFCHAIVFLLLINNLKCDIEEISKHVKFSARTLITKFRVAGATIVIQGGKKFAQLKLPLVTVGSERRKSAKF